MDRELLELAANAVGLRLLEKEKADRKKCYPEVAALYLLDERCRPIAGWNPLENDGDALRLAVKLGLSIDRTASTVMAFDGRVRAQEDSRDNPYAATRRAIVCAAAEIGRQVVRPE